jgi:hypothetical protein
MFMPLMHARLDSHAGDTSANVGGFAGEDAEEADGPKTDETLDEVLERLASIIFIT